MPSLAVLPCEDVAVADVTDRLETHLRSVLSALREGWRRVDPWLAEPLSLLEGFVLQGGKRLRPLFCVYGFLGAGGDLEDPLLLDAAAALELLHTFALVHDDVMDGSDCRRGHPSLHRALEESHRHSAGRGESRRFGEGVAVLLGDLAFACANRLVTSLPSPARDVWNEMTVELMMGQYLDVAGAAAGPSAGPGPTTPGPAGPTAGLDRAMRIARYKSGSYTVERPLHLGAALAGDLGEMRHVYSRFGRPLGEAFQLRDDLLGAFGDARATGKPVGEDLRRGKPTALLEVARRRSGPAGERLLERAGAPDLDEDDVRRMVTLLGECGARDEVEQMITERHRKALAALAGAPVRGRAREHLEQLAALALWRRS